jgi:hypothetical protein
MFRMVTPPIIGGHVTVITESGTGQTVFATFRCRGAAADETSVASVNNCPTRCDYIQFIIFL